MHGWHAYDCDPLCFEGALLLEIETLQRSDKATHNMIFKNRESGGMVVFGPWYKYALQHLLQLASSVNDPTSLGEYTAIKIIRSLFSFITDNLKEVVKPGKLEALRTDFGVDWMRNVDTTRRVINDYGGADHFFYMEFAMLEAHVEILKSKTKTT